MQSKRQDVVHNGHVDLDHAVEGVVQVDALVANVAQRDVELALVARHFLHAEDCAREVAVGVKAACHAKDVELAVLKVAAS